jgi:hypothetical protein
MRVDNEIWHDTLTSEWKVLLPVSHPHSTFLPMATGELISDLWDTLRSHLDLGEALPLLVHCEDNLIYLACFGVLDASRAIFLGLDKQGIEGLLWVLSEIRLLHHCSLADDDIIPTHLHTRVDQPIKV